jgi:ribosomal protein L18E
MRNVMLYLQFSRTIKRISRDLLKRLKARRRNKKYVELSNHVVHRLSLIHSVVVSLLVP